MYTSYIHVYIIYPYSLFVKSHLPFATSGDRKAAPLVAEPRAEHSRPQWRRNAAAYLGDSKACRGLQQREAGTKGECVPRRTHSRNLTSVSKNPRRQHKATESIVGPLEMHSTWLLRSQNRETPTELRRSPDYHLPPNSCVLTRFGFFVFGAVSGAVTCGSLYPLIRLFSSSP